MPLVESSVIYVHYDKIYILPEKFITMYKKHESNLGYKLLTYNFEAYAVSEWQVRLLYFHSFFV